ncbi:helicase associated domain-containing protein [Streptomyces sp. WAC05292]|uniref:helicase associated domain-containing protein n=1 Tax=Streptomyces sp. WAC05292 TaxID=2487418 RepID=UPI0026B99A90
MPRKHIETIVVCGDGEDQKQRELRLGAWISNQRSRAAPLTPERMELLSALLRHAWVYGPLWTSEAHRSGWSW